MCHGQKQSYLAPPTDRKFQFRPDTPGFGTKKRREKSDNGVEALSVLICSNSHGLGSGSYILNPEPCTMHPLIPNHLISRMSKEDGAGDSKNKKTVYDMIDVLREGGMVTN